LGRGEGPDLLDAFGRSPWRRARRSARCARRSATWDPPRRAERPAVAGTWALPGAGPVDEARRRRV